VAEVLPWLNLLLIPTLGYVLSIDRRITRLEALREADDNAERQRAARLA
jgi:hypothetical protein